MAATQFCAPARSFRFPGPPADAHRLTASRFEGDPVGLDAVTARARGVRECCDRRPAWSSLRFRSTGHSGRNIYVC